MEESSQPTDMNEFHPVSIEEPDPILEKEEEDEIPADTIPSEPTVGETLQSVIDSLNRIFDGMEGSGDKFNIIRGRLSHAIGDIQEVIRNQE